MAYYVRSDIPSGRYIRTDVPDGRYLAHSAKGTEWSKGHKYVDKRWIQGAWHYLYPEMLEAAKRAGDAVKDTAKNVGENAKKTADKVVKATKDFKDYSKKVDEKEQKAQLGSAEAKVNQAKAEIKRSEERKRQQEARERANTAVETEMASQKAYNSLHEKYEKEQKDAEAHLEALREKIHNGGVVNQKEWQDAYDRIDAAKESLSNLESTREKNREDLHSENQKAANAARAAEVKEIAYLHEAEKQAKLREKFDEEQREAYEEKQELKYKASKALNDIIDGTTGITAQGAKWLRDQYNAGNKWAAATLASIEARGASAVAKGNYFLSKLVKGSSKSRSQPASSSSSGRNYSGVGTKAQRREAVGGGPVSNNDYSNRPKKRR